LDGFDVLFDGQNLGGELAEHLAEHLTAIPRIQTELKLRQNLGDARGRNCLFFFFFFFLHILRVNLLVILDLNLSLRRPAVVLFVL
jgi:hypothetical protein